MGLNGGGGGGGGGGGSIVEASAGQGIEVAEFESVVEGPGLSAPFVVFVLTVKAIETVVIKDPVFIHRALGGKVFDGNLQKAKQSFKKY